MEKELLKIARSIQAISQSGLHFAKDEFDRIRYKELKNLSLKLYECISDAPIHKIKDIFIHEEGFQTPKVDVRAVVVRDGNVLLTREKSDQKWSLPGGFADVNFSPSQIAEKEVEEETGLHVNTNRLLAVIDANKHHFPALEYHYYKIIVLCDLQEGELRGSEETEESAFFAFDSLPDLSEKRNTYELMKKIQQLIDKEEVYMD